MFGRATITLDIGPHSGFNIGLSDEPGSGCGMWIRQILRIKNSFYLLTCQVRVVDRFSDWLTFADTENDCFGGRVVKL